MLTRRQMLGMAALLAGAVASGGLAGCGSSSADELAVRDAVTATMEPYVAEEPPSDAVAILGDATQAELREYGIDASEYVRRCLANLSYEVGDVTVDGDTATVGLSVTNLDVTAAMSAAASRFDAYADTDEAETAYEDGGEAALMAKLFDYLFEAMGSSAELVTTTVDVTCAKDEAGVWGCSFDDNPALKAAILGQAS